MAERIDLIVGLGNPDPEYLTTRHNAGFWFVDALAQEHGSNFSSNKKLLGDTCEIRIGERRIRLLKPTTYMNESGQAVGATVNYFRIEPEDVLVVYDELDLPPGTARLKFNGGNAGHNGIRSVSAHIGRDFWRLRLGVGHPGDKGRVIGHVLKRASDDEEAAILDAIRRGIDILPTLLEHGSARAQNVLHTRPPEPEDGADDS